MAVMMWEVVVPAMVVTLWLLTMVSVAAGRVAVMVVTRLVLVLVRADGTVPMDSTVGLTLMDSTLMPLSVVGVAVLSVT